jgi:hypothetical protein
MRRAKSLHRRLADIEGRLTDIKFSGRLRDCDCGVKIINFVSEEATAAASEANRNRACPAHGLNHRRKLIIIHSVPCERQPEVVCTIEK